MAHVGVLGYPWAKRWMSRDTDLFLLDHDGPDDFVAFTTEAAVLMRTPTSRINRDYSSS
jgi:hypothetical protein